MTDFQQVVLLLLAAGVVGIWVISILLRKGMNEHIRAMQAIYELLEKRERHGG
jgi:hypothetical protein